MPKRVRLGTKTVINFNINIFMMTSFGFPADRSDQTGFTQTEWSVIVVSWMPVEAVGSIIQSSVAEAIITVEG